jgi:hypothetical protein
VSGFSEVVLEKFADMKEVDVETRSADGKLHSVIIWIVVVDRVPYVRSVRGPKGRWFRELMARKEGAIKVGGVRYPVRPKLVKDEATNELVSRAIRTKYKTSQASVIAMLRPEVLETTARLEPAGA